MFTLPWLSSAEEEAVGLMAGMLIVYIVIYLIAMAISIAAYILESLGIYTIAKRRQIKNPWLAWIPVGNMWMWGSIADQYQFVVKGKVKNTRKVILGLSIALYAVLAVFIGQYVSYIVDMVMNMDGMEYVSDAQMMQMLMGPLMGMVGTYLVMLVVSIVLMVFQYMALYNLFTSCDPANNVMYLVLSILFSIARPFLIFICRNKDLGMPPRRDSFAPQQPVYPQQAYIQPGFQQPVYQPPVPPQQPVYQPPVPPQQPVYQPPYAPENTGENGEQ